MSIYVSEASTWEHQKWKRFAFYLQISPVLIYEIFNFLIKENQAFPIFRNEFLIFQFMKFYIS